MRNHEKCFDSILSSKGSSLNAQWPHKEVEAFDDGHLTLYKLEVCTSTILPPDGGRARISSQQKFSSKNYQSVSSPDVSVPAGVVHSIPSIRRILSRVSSCNNIRLHKFRIFARVIVPRPKTSKSVLYSSTKKSKNWIAERCSQGQITGTRTGTKTDATFT